jgi:hypothetical protein
LFNNETGWVEIISILSLLGINCAPHKNNIVIKESLDAIINPWGPGK